MKPSVLAVALASLLALSGCQDRAVPEPDPGATSAPSEAAAQPPAVLAEAPAAGTFAPVDPSAVPATARAICSIDRVGSESDLKDPVAVTGSTVVSGWIAGPGNVVPASFRIVLSGTAVMAAQATTGESRPDVARVLEADSLANAGFNARVDFSGVPEGEYALSLMTGEGSARCETPVRIVVGATTSEP